MTLFIYEDFVLDHASVPMSYFDQPEEQQMLDVVDRYYSNQLLYREMSAQQTSLLGA